MNIDATIAAIPAALAGIAAAQLAGPLSLGWPGRASELLARMAALARKRPSRRAKAVGAVLIATVLVGGAWAAYAAAPAAPRRAIAQAVRVAGATVRDAFVEPRPVPATVARTPAAAEAGLRAAAASPEDEALAAAAIAKGAWDGKTAEPGLSVEETRDYYVLQQKQQNLAAAWRADILARAAKAGLPTPFPTQTMNELAAMLGPERARYVELSNRTTIGRIEAGEAAFDRYGPVTVHVPAGADRATVIAPYEGASWGLPTNRQGDGAYDLTIIRPGPPPQGLMLNTDPLPPKIIAYPTGISPQGAVTYTFGPLPPML